MTQKKKHLIYAAVIGVGLVVLAVDRFLLGGATDPANALANGIAAVVTPGSAIALGMGESSSGVPVLPFPRNLPAFDEKMDTQRDFFSPPGAQEDVAEGADKSQEKAAEISTTEQFVQNHHLEGTLVGRSHRLAIINGRRLHPGAMLDEFVLTEITAHTVVFQRGAETVVLRAAGPLEKLAPATAPTP